MITGNLIKILTYVKFHGFIKLAFKANATIGATFIT